MTTKGREKGIQLEIFGCTMPSDLSLDVFLGKKRYEIQRREKKLIKKNVY